MADDEIYTLPKKELIRFDEAATYCRVSDRTIWRWAENGIIDLVVLPSGMKRIKRESLLASPVVREHLGLVEAEQEAREAEVLGKEYRPKRRGRPAKKEK